MHMKRFYTHAKHAWNPDQVFQNIKFKIVNSVVRTATGEIVSQIDNVEVPETWSQTAVDIYATKYIRKAGVPNKTIAVEEKDVPEWLQRRIPAGDAVIGKETSIKQTVNRLAGCWTYHGWINGYFENEADAQTFYDELRYMMIHQICAPNSPQWFNTGLHWAYGIKGQPGKQYHYDRDTGKIKQSTTAYEFPQVHACFILEIRDDLINKNGIMDSILQEACIFKYGSGAGANFSAIRGTNEKLSGGGYSSGLLSFLEVSNRSAGAIKSGGTTRRAAKMVIIDDDHPDVVEFIMWKIKAEAKVLSLVMGSEKIEKHINAITHACERYTGDKKDRMDPNMNLALKFALNDAVTSGIPQAYCEHIMHAFDSGIDIDWEVFNYDWNGEAYRIAGGQNSNNSIRISDKFMKAVKNDEDWHLIARTDKRIMKTLKARRLWDLICYGAWSCADPGVQYHDTIQSWHTCKASGQIRGSNPCSEYLFLDNTACNLASINLDKMLIYTDEGITKFNIEAFEYACNILTVVLDISVQMAQYPTYDFAERSLEFRTLGLGYCSMGSMFMSLGVAYDSDQSRAIASAISAIMTWSSYNCSAILAKKLGVFEKYAENKESFLNVMENMYAATYHDTDHYKGLNKQPTLYKLEKHFDYIGEAAQKVAKEALHNIKTHGIRNAQATVVAPTGTIGLVMDCGTTSIEPTFSLVSWKKLAGGGDMRILNRTVIDALHSLKYTEHQIDDISKYVFGHTDLAHAPHINNASLAKKGFTPEMLTKMNHALKNAYDIKHILNVGFFGEAVIKQHLKLDLNSSDNLLESLGWTQDQISQANIHCCGHLTIEGAPHIKEEHISIFDCASANGVGTRTISPEGHYKMLAAIQPFISGAASKTINIPSETNISEISKIYFQTWDLGIKCVALYRDHSKLSQVLYTTNFNKNEVKATSKDVHGHRYGMRLDNQAFYILTQENEQGLLTEIDIVMGKEGSSYRTLMDCFAQAISLGLKYNIPLSKYIDAFKNTAFEPAGFVRGYHGVDKALSPLDLLARVLEQEYVAKNKDTSISQFNLLSIDSICKSRRAQATIDGHDFKLVATEIEEAGQVRLAEVFFKMSKEGSAFCSLMSNFAKAISIALRARVPFEVIYKTFIGTQFAPYGFVIGDPYIRRAESIIDFAFQCLGRWYLPELHQRTTNIHDTTFEYSTEKNAHNEHGNTCSVCLGFNLKQNGSCFVCSDCGTTTGCS